MITGVPAYIGFKMVRDMSHGGGGDIDASGLLCALLVVICAIIIYSEIKNG